ncbi:hypothetical protein VN97_g6715 [Penicillium thymicola]|uniref:Uncharacterized protein n=1 Tax=Penicillium thymicola TaxID=293382 RepID=A0AAI9X7D3_PENTH|nr:hypothetical protein VN97_g6715 [Penicillium thymicola]
MHRRGGRELIAIEEEKLLDKLQFGGLMPEAPMWGLRPPQQNDDHYTHDPSFHNRLRGLWNIASRPTQWYRPQIISD